MNFDKKITDNDLEDALHLTGQDIREQYAEDILYCERVAFEKTFNISSNLVPKKGEGFWFYPSQDDPRHGAGEMWRTFFLARYIKHTIQLNQLNDEYYQIVQWIQKNQPSQVCQFVFELMLVEESTTDLESLKRFIHACFPNTYVPSPQEYWVLGALDTLMRLNPFDISWTENDPIRLFLLSLEPDALKDYPSLEKWAQPICAPNIERRSLLLPVSAIINMIDVIADRFSDRCPDSPVMNTLRLSLPKPKAPEPKPNRVYCTII